MHSHTAGGTCWVCSPTRPASCPRSCSLFSVDLDVKGSQVQEVPLSQRGVHQCHATCCVLLKRVVDCRPGGEDDVNVRFHGRFYGGMIMYFSLQSMIMVQFAIRSQSNASRAFCASTIMPLSDGSACPATKAGCRWATGCPSGIEARTTVPLDHCLVQMAQVVLIMQRIMTYHFLLAIGSQVCNAGSLACIEV